MALAMASALARTIGDTSDVDIAAWPSSRHRSESGGAIGQTRRLERFYVHRSAAIDDLAARALASVGNDARDWILRFSLYLPVRFLS